MECQLKYCNDCVGRLRAFEITGDLQRFFDMNHLGELCLEK